jgi:hypothetical protein
VYLRPPPGAQHLAGGSGRVLCLRRALYGLRQASSAWNKRLESELTTKGFVQSNADPSLWILHGEHGATMAMFYVDDGVGLQALPTKLMRSWTWWHPCSQSAHSESLKIFLVLRYRVTEMRAPSASVRVACSHVQCCWCTQGHAHVS